MTLRSVNDIIRSVPRGNADVLPAPEHQFQLKPDCLRMAFAVESMAQHMSDEGHKLFGGLEGMYSVCWQGCDVAEQIKGAHPTTALIQDKREWEGLTADRSRDPAMRFRNIEALRDRPDIFKLTVLKDAQHDAAYNRQAADEIGCHAWVVYYNERLVQHLSPFVRPEHLVRTYHSVDASLVPSFQEYSRHPVILSGAVSRAYPLRTRLADERHGIPEMSYLKHPGYHRRGCETPQYLETLGRFKVAICTSSVYGYAVRKIIEATACGCMVLTDLPTDEVLPEIDDNLTRIPPDMPTSEIRHLLQNMVATWNPHWQREFALKAKAYYDYKVLGRKLAADIEKLRQGYGR